MLNKVTTYNVMGAVIDSGQFATLQEAHSFGRSDDNPCVLSYKLIDELGTETEFMFDPEEFELSGRGWWPVLEEEN
jgi:hypothetical protein